jgi:hypothetical protein
MQQAPDCVTRAACCWLGAMASGAPAAGCCARWHLPASPPPRSSPQQPFPRLQTPPRCPHTPPPTIAAATHAQTCGATSCWMGLTAGWPKEGDAWTGAGCCAGDGQPHTLAAACDVPPAPRCVDDECGLCTGKGRGHQQCRPNCRTRVLLHHEGEWGVPSRPRRPGRRAAQQPGGAPRQCASCAAASCMPPPARHARGWPTLSSQLAPLRRATVWHPPRSVCSTQPTCACPRPPASCACACATCLPHTPQDASLCVARSHHRHAPTPTSHARAAALSLCRRQPHHNTLCVPAHLTVHLRHTHARALTFSHTRPVSPSVHTPALAAASQVVHHTRVGDETQPSPAPPPTVDAHVQ